jgi:U3 small nucleolar RNA-associated protein 19
MKQKGAYMTVQEIRKLESSLEDPKNSNNFVKLRQIMDDEEEESPLRMAALHSLRRVLLRLIGSKKLCRSSKEEDERVTKYRMWLHRQYTAYCGSLCEWVRSGMSIEGQVASIRTLLEFVRIECDMSSASECPTSVTFFGLKTFRSLISALFECPDLNIDVLLVVKEDIFEKPDALFYSFLVLQEQLKGVKMWHVASKTSRTSSSSSISGAPSGSFQDVELAVQRGIDMLRLMVVPEHINEDEFLIPGVGADTSEDQGAVDSDSDSDSEDETLPSTRRGPGMKRGLPKSTGNNVSRKRHRLGRSEQLRIREHYCKLLTKAWMTLLSLPLTPRQHKTVLQHLPDHVIPDMPGSSPLLLADYFTRSYEQGGAVAVLALKSLFQLIVQHNLDYPNFFLSLYRLCTLEVLNAKYKSTFLHLLSASLQSTNLSAYAAAAFAKRLATLALTGPTPSAPFCIAQGIRLLKRHPQIQRLIHRGPNTSGSSSSSSSSSSNSSSNSSSSSGSRDSSGVGQSRIKGKEKSYADEAQRLEAEVDQMASTGPDEFCWEEESSLEKTGALGRRSSLWEFQALQNHHNALVSAMATKLKNPQSTASAEMLARLKMLAERNGQEGEKEEISVADLEPEFWIDATYSTMLLEQTAHARKAPEKTAPRAIQPPTSLLGGDGPRPQLDFGSVFSVFSG